jgi:hypothetical protein
MKKVLKCQNMNSPGSLQVKIIYRTTIATARQPV